MREVKPGEIIAIDREGLRILQMPTLPLKRCVFEHVYFARPDSYVFGGSVDRARRALGRQLAQEQPAPGADLVFAVPDSSNSAAARLRRGVGAARWSMALIRNHYVGRTFIQPTQGDRDAKVKVKYNPVREVLAGKSVVMVDDSIVRGTTTRGLVALIRAAGAREVHMRVSSPPITGPCYYGIDTPRKEELIAANYSVAGDREADRRRLARLPLARGNAGGRAGWTRRILSRLLLRRIPDRSAVGADKYHLVAAKWPGLGMGPGELELRSRVS